MREYYFVIDSLAVPRTQNGHSSAQSVIAVLEIYKPLERCDFFLWGFMKDRVYFPPLPNDFPHLRHRIEEAIASITPDLLIEV